VHRRTFVLVALSALTLAAATAGEDARPPLPSQGPESLPEGAVARLGVSRFENFGRTFAVAFSPDGMHLAAGGWDGTITWWDLTTRRSLRQWEAHSGPVTAVAMAPDGRAVASAGTGREIRLWSAAEGKLLKALTTSGARIKTLTFSPSSRLLASADGKGASLWDLAGGRLLRHFKGGRAPTFSADGATLTLFREKPPQGRGGREGTVLRLAVSDGKEQASRTLSAAPADRSALSASGRWLVRAGPFALQWTDLTSGRETRSPAKEQVAITGLAIAPDERSVVVARADGRVLVIEMATGQVRCQFRRSGRSETCLAVSPDGRLLASGERDRTILLWDLTGCLVNGKVPAVALSAAELGRLWDELNAADGATAHRAVWRLTAGARDSVPFLEKQLAPQRPVERERIARLIRELRNENFQARTRASRELEGLRDAAEPALRKSLTDSIPLEMRRRLETLLERIDLWWARQGRILRVVEVLERSAGPEARQVLRRWADGGASPRLAAEAATALRRLDRLEAGAAGQQPTPRP
jgi:hypothetical protein